MESIPTATANAVACDDPLFDLADFFEQSSYDDDVIEDLPTFLEMATYDDPIDDLATFFEKACRWACCKRLVGPDGTFYLFAELPCEIRLMIWRQCIPSQIHLLAERMHEGRTVEELRARDPFVESVFERRYDRKFDIWQSGFSHRDPRTEIYDWLIDPLQAEHLHGFPRAYPYHSRYCTLDYPMAFEQKTPVIAKVNKEARMLALKGGSKNYNLAFVHINLNEWMNRIEESPVWLNDKNDTVLINTHYMTTSQQRLKQEIFVPKDGKFGYKADRLLDMITRNTVQVAIFAAALLDSKAPADLIYSLANADRVDVVVGVIRFDRMPDSEAANTDLFGPLGDQSMALIPATSPQCLGKLFMAHAAFRPQCAAEYFRPSDAQYIREAYIPDKYANWDRCRRPSDFDEYCEEMLGFAQCIMAACEYELKSKWQWRWAVRRLQKNVETVFKDTFQPVFLVHRCRNPVLIDFRKQEG